LQAREGIEGEEAGREERSKGNAGYGEREEGFDAKDDIPDEIQAHDDTGGVVLGAC
jgi:hypothetical protein